jgi:zinc transporter
MLNSLMRFVLINTHQLIVESPSATTIQFDGKGGILPLLNEREVSDQQPCWLTLDYQASACQQWLMTSPLLPENVRQPLSGDSVRPRVLRAGEGTLLTLRAINSNQGARPEQLITLRIYLTSCMVITTHHRQLAVQEAINKDLALGQGPASVGEWIVLVCDELTETTSNFIEDLHDRIIDFEDDLLEQRLPERGEMALLRKQLIVLRRYMSPQRDIFSRLASDRFSWMNDEQRRSMQEITDRLGRGLDDLDACIARTDVLSDEISTLMADALNRRTYTMSILAMIFLPISFLTGLFGVNLGGLPGAGSPYAFLTFCCLLLALVCGVAWWLKHRNWL